MTTKTYQWSKYTDSQRFQVKESGSTATDTVYLKKNELSIQ